MTLRGVLRPASALVVGLATASDRLFHHQLLVLMVWHGFRTVFDGLFLTALLIAAVMDIRARRVPNHLCLALFALGILAAFSGLGFVSWQGALLGAACGLALWLPFWILGLLGAGDVKFFAASCAWIGPSLAWRSSLGVALLGGLMACVLMARQRGLRSAVEFGALSPTNARAILGNARSGTAAASAHSFPYAVPMAMTVAIARFYPAVFF